MKKVYELKSQPTYMYLEIFLASRVDLIHENESQVQTEPIGQQIEPLNTADINVAESVSLLLKLAMRS